MTSCTVEPYESGDSSLSYLMAEMVDMHVVGNEVRSIVTDADETLTVASSYKVPQRIEHRDTTYRMLLYYNKVEKTPVDIRSMRLAYVVRPSAKENALTLANDPLKIISAWKAENGAYINLSLGLMTGNADDEDAIHKISVVGDSTVTSSDGIKTHYLTFHHDQDGIPEYYTQNVYVSIPITGVAAGDKICVRLNTYSGGVDKLFEK